MTIHGIFEGNAFFFFFFLFLFPPFAVVVVFIDVLFLILHGIYYIQFSIDE